MNTVKIELNGLDISNLTAQLETLTNALNGNAKANQSEPTETAPEKLLTRIETAKLLGVTLPTIIDWQKKGILKGYRIGNRIRYKHAEIMETVTNNKTH